MPTQRIGRPRTLAGSVIVSHITQDIDLRSANGTSRLRDHDLSTGSGGVSLVGQEIELATGTTAGSKATLESAQRGRTRLGAMGEATMSIRATHEFSGDQDAKWGYYNSQDGFGFGKDANGLYVFHRDGGADTVHYQKDWNVNKCNDGQANLDLSISQIFGVNISWYGTGTIEWWVEFARGNGKQDVVVVHRENPDAHAAAPGLLVGQPITLEVNNGSTTEDVKLYVLGRAFSYYGEVNAHRRINSEYVLEATLDSTNQPYISIRKKSAYTHTLVKIEGFDMVGDADLIFQIYYNPTLTGASWGTPTDTNADETAIESDTSATAFSGGDLIYEGLLSSTKKTGVQFILTESFSLELPDNGEHFTLVARRFPSENNGILSAVWRFAEEW